MKQKNPTKYQREEEEKEEEEEEEEEELIVYGISTTSILLYV